MTKNNIFLELNKLVFNYNQEVISTWAWICKSTICQERCWPTSTADISNNTLYYIYALMEDDITFIISFVFNTFDAVQNKRKICFS